MIHTSRIKIFMTRLSRMLSKYKETPSKKGFYKYLIKANFSPEVVAKDYNVAEIDMPMLVRHLSNIKRYHDNQTHKKLDPIPTDLSVYDSGVFNALSNGASIAEIQDALHIVLFEDLLESVSSEYVKQAILERKEKDELDE